MVRKRVVTAYAHGNSPDLLHVEAADRWQGGSSCTTWVQTCLFNRLFIAFLLPQGHRYWQTVLCKLTNCAAKSPCIMKLLLEHAYSSYPLLIHAEEPISGWQFSGSTRPGNESTYNIQASSGCKCGIIFSHPPSPFPPSCTRRRGKQSLLVIYRTTCWREVFVYLDTYCTSAAAPNTSCWKTCVSPGPVQIGISISSGSGEDRSDSVTSPMASPPNDGIRTVRMQMNRYAATRIYEDKNIQVCTKLIDLFIFFFC